MENIESTRLKDAADNFYREVYDKNCISPILCKYRDDIRICFEWRDLFIIFYLEKLRILVDVEINSRKHTYQTIEEFQKYIDTFNFGVNYII